MNTTRIWIGGIVAALLIAALLLLGIYAYNHIGVSTGASGDRASADEPSMIPARITAFTVERPNFVAEGSGLGRVEIWAVPAGAGATEENHQLLGGATLRSGSLAGAQVWTLPIPSSPVAATEIYAKGFDQDGTAAARMSLPYLGASAIHEAVWGGGQGTPGGPSGGTDDTQRNFSFSLAVGQKRTVGALTVKLAEITSDSRCPQNAVCIWAGEVTAQVELSADGKNQSVEMRSSGATSYVFGNYRIALAGVSPARRTGDALSQKDYRVDFAVERL